MSVILEQDSGSIELRRAPDLAPKRERLRELGLDPRPGSLRSGPRVAVHRASHHTKPLTSMLDQSVDPPMIIRHGWVLRPQSVINGDSVDLKDQVAEPAATGGPNSEGDIEKRITDGDRVVGKAHLRLRGETESVCSELVEWCIREQIATLAE